MEANNSHERMEIMKRRKVRAGLLIFCAALVLLGFSPEARLGKLAGVTPSAQAKDEDSAAPSIEGSWRVVVSAPNSPDQYVLETYADGGGYVSSSSLDVFADGAGPGHGTWAKTGPKWFTTTFEKFTQSGLLKLNQTVRVHGDTYTGVASLSFCDSSGEHCGPPVGCFTLIGKRIRAEPPSCP
jgi:hypothetical protein